MPAVDDGDKIDGRSEALFWLLSAEATLAIDKRRTRAAAAKRHGRWRPAWEKRDGYFVCRGRRAEELLEYEPMMAVV